MKLTKELLKEKGACAAGYRDFLKEYPVDKYPDGVEYQELLDCCAEKNFSYGSWLLGAFGKTDEVRKIGGDLIAEKGIIFAGQLEAEGCIKAGWGIEAGEGIEAGGGIEAGEGIEAGWGIKAGRGIEAGEGIKAGWGIDAGFGIKAGWGIEAGDGIKAGLGIEAGWGIEAGDEFGIYAGLCCRVTNKALRKIIAKERPENIMCGEFEEKSDSEGKKDGV